MIQRLTNRQIINVVKTYNNYMNKISKYRKQQIYYDAFDDKEGVSKMQRMIDDEKKRIGRFLDKEV